MWKAGYWGMSLVGGLVQIPRVPVVCPFTPLGGEGSVLIGLDPGWSQLEKSKSQEREVALLLCQGRIGNCSTHLRPHNSVPPWLSFLEDTSLESFGCWWCGATSDHRKLKLRGYKPGEGRKLRRVRLPWIPRGWESRVASGQSRKATGTWVCSYLRELFPEQ